MPDFKPFRFGKYLLLEKIASGGMAQLYRAKIIGVQGFEKFIAIKQILPHLAEEKDLLSSFIHEAKLAALLNHQNIVQIYDFGEMEGMYFITMEYLFGKDLRNIANKLKEKSLSLSLEHCLYIMTRICAGLDYAHQLKDFQGKPLNIIHRDISPQNIIITYEGDVKIVDFGIAKAQSQTTFTQAGMIKGKVAYMSPEQAAGKAIDHRSDIFPCGILLYEMLSGKRMFMGDTLQILSKVLRAEFEPPEAAISGLPPKLYRILHLALAKDPEERYQSCGEMLADLEECMAEISLRPTARGLSQYLKDLFQEEIAAEEAVIKEAADFSMEPEGKISATGKISETSVVSESEAPKAEGKRKIIYGAIASAVVIALGVAISFWLRAKPATKPEKGLQPAFVHSYSKPSEPSVRSQPAPPEPLKKASEKDSDPARAKALQSEASGLLESHPDKAKSLLIEAIKLDPRNVQGHLQLGLAYMKLKDYPKAIKTYAKAAELDPQFPDTFFNLGYIYAKDKDYKRAEEMYSRVVKLAPSYLDEALFNLGAVQEKLGKRKESVENLERALSVNPKNELARKLLNKVKGKS